MGYGGLDIIVLINYYYLDFFKLRLGALIPRSVGRSVGLSVCRSSKNYKKITKLYKTLQNVTKHYKTLK